MISKYELKGYTPNIHKWYLGMCETLVMGNSAFLRIRKSELWLSSYPVGFYPASNTVKRMGVMALFRNSYIGMDAVIGGVGLYKYATG